MKSYFLSIGLIFGTCCSALYGLTVTSGTFQVSGSGLQTNTQLSISTEGKAMSIWSQNLPNQVTAAYFNGSTWFSAVTLATGSFPQVGIDGFGNAIATWLDGTTNQVFVSRFTASTLTWGTAVQLSTTGTYNASPQVAVNTAGFALVVWVLANPNQLLATTFDPRTSTWSTPVTLASAIGGFPLVALDDFNKGIVMWSANQYGIEAVSVTVP